MTDDSASLPLHRDPRIIDAAVAALAQLRERASTSVGLMLTDDGFEIARNPGAESADMRLASMSSSLQALSEAIARELDLGQTRFALVDAAEGHVLLMRVPDREIVLAVVFDERNTLGIVLSATRHVVAEFGAAIAD